MGIEEEGNLTTGQDQVHDLLFNREIGWKEIIFDLINTEQLDPWDVDIGVLSDKFFVRIDEMEQMDFFVSSKVLFAASLLLRLKSELILNKYIRSIDDVLFGRDEESQRKKILERIELDEDIPDLIPKSPMPRYRKVTLHELIESLNKAIVTENRRIKKTIVNQNALRETGITLPKRKSNIANKVKTIHGRIIAHFDANASHKRVAYTHLIGEEKEERALSFFPLLELESNGKIWLDQEASFEEIHIWMKHIFLKHNPDPFEDLRLDVSVLTPEETARLDAVEKLGDLIDEE